MAQRYDADREPIGSLLTTTSPRILVPEWQRSYSWEGPQIETFWNDLVTFSERYPGETIVGQEYFLGSIVLVTGGSTLELLDGQQRLATATILLSVLRDAREKYNGESATRLQTKYIGDYDDAKDQTEYNLTLNRYDWQFFRTEIQERTKPEDRPKPTLKSHKRIRTAREYFEREVAAGMATCEDNKTAHQWVLRVGEVLLNHMSVVAVSSTDPDNAAAVFETLNDRGIGLSTTDLLRNFLLREAGKDEEARERIVIAWETVLEVDDESRATVDKFLRHYWVSHQGDVKNRKLYREIKETLQNEGPDALTFSEALADTAPVYRDLVAARDDDPDLERLLQAIKDLGAEPLYPALLASYAAASEQTLDAQKTFIAALITMFVRSSVIGGREAGRIESTVYGVARSLRETKDYGAAVAALQEFAPSAEEFVGSFAKATVSRAATARYLLREIEHAKRQTQEVKVETPDRVHLEHIYPQKPEQGARWPNHAAMINRLGNLTLLGKSLNTSVRNSAFAVKKEKAYETSDILMTEELLEYQDWSSEAVSNRQQELASWAFEIWSFPDEAKPEVEKALEVASGDEPNVSELPDVPDTSPPQPEGSEESKV